MFYKFLHTKDINHILRDGTVVISKMSHFQRVEAERKQWIVDAREGTAVLNAPPELRLTKHSSELQSVNHALAGLFGENFAHIESGGVIDMGGAIFNITLPFFIYSFSCGDLDALTSAMCAKCTTERPIRCMPSHQ